MYIAFDKYLNNVRLGAAFENKVYFLCILLMHLLDLLDIHKLFAIIIIQSRILCTSINWYGGI